MSAALNTNLQRMKAKDVAVKAVSKCGKWRVAFVNTRSVTNQAIARHDLFARTQGNLEYLRLFGTTISFTNMMASFLQAEERFKCSFVAEEATACCESLALGECRAYVSNNAEGTISDTLKCDRVLYRESTPVVSVTNWGGVSDEELEANPLLQTQTLLDYNLTPHAANFFAKSEGVKTAIGLACAITPPESGTSPTTGSEICAYSSGVMLQPIAIPDHEVDAVIPRVQAILDHFALVTNGELSETYLSCQDALALVTGDVQGAKDVAAAARQNVLDSCHDAVSVYRRRGGDMPPPWSGHHWISSAAARRRATCSLSSRWGRRSSSSCCWNLGKWARAAATAANSSWPPPTIWGSLFRCLKCALC